MSTIMEALRELNAEKKVVKEVVKPITESKNVEVENKTLADKLLENEEICPTCGNKKNECICEKCSNDDEIIEIIDDKEELEESDKPAAASIEDAQKWVDYDMEKYGRISGRTNRLVRKAGFQIVKDDHGDYEVIAGQFESLKESSEKDDIEADADDKKEAAKAEFEKKEDDADADKDEKLDEAEESNDCIHDACIKLGIDYDSIGTTEGGWDYVIGEHYTDNDLIRVIEYCRDKGFEKTTGHLHKLINDNDSMLFYVVNKKEITEDFESSKPVEILPKDEIIDFVKNVKPGTFFKLGVMRELRSEIASKFRGGRGSDDALPIRIVKCSESYVATGEDYEAQKETIARREQGIERSERKTGFNMSEDPDLKNKIFISGNGESLAYYPRRGSVPKVKYFLSIDDGDLEEVSKQDIIPYLTPAQAAKLSGTQETDDAETAPVANALKVNLDKIYYIGNLGHSIM